MMEIELKYGSETLTAKLSHIKSVQELQPRRVATLQTVEAMLTYSLGKPIGTYPFARLFQRARNLALVLPPYRAGDPVWQMLPFVLKVLHDNGVQDEEVKILIGYHATYGDASLNAEPVIQLQERYSVFVHDLHDAGELEYVGETRSGLPVFVNRILLDVEHIVLLGAVEYGLLPDFDGGPRMVVPGCAGYETLARICAQTYNAKTRRFDLLLDSHEETRALLRQNLREAYKCLPATFGLYPVANGKGQIIAAPAGHPIQAHIAGSKMIECLYKIPVFQQADLTIVSPGGSLHDATFRSAFRSLCQAAKATRPGGVIILTAECRDGLGMDAFRKHFPANGDKDGEARLHLFAMPEDIISATISQLVHRFRIFLISALEKKVVRRMGMQAADSLDEAFDCAMQEMPFSPVVHILPQGNPINPIPVMSHLEPVNQELRTN
ncbi:MAG: lactate racemase domain-containing protein [candidate division KSB1 bacterium]|nr:lactate racemase domain-containing protein [candidate division KSB1 bacterium]MDQ7063078.1 lactate racemase domain-containing protein [candidate division KSB1 bacterium]